MFFEITGVEYVGGWGYDVKLDGVVIYALDDTEGATYPDAYNAERAGKRFVARAFHSILHAAASDED